ncbi:MAG TPA: hypothetical protein VHW43_05865, partial [Puia sp.]|nr:hypothetical protein [Puia sp.]
RMNSFASVGVVTSISCIMPNKCAENALSEKLAHFGKTLMSVLRTSRRGDLWKKQKYSIFNFPHEPLPLQPN